MKEAYYFPHDYNARHDPKILNLRARYGLAGVGAYWCLIETLYEQGGEISTKNLIGITADLQADTEMTESIIRDFDLFEINGEYIQSNAVIKRLEERKCKSDLQKARVQKRWNNTKNQEDSEFGITSVLPNKISVLPNDTNKRKERKEKESKIKEIKKERSTPRKGVSPSLMLPDGIDEDYREIYTEWLMYRKEIKKPFASQRSVNQNYKELIKLSNNNPETAKAIVNQSIANGWQGLFKLKDDERNQINTGRYRGGRTGIEVTATCADDYNTPF